MLYVVLECLCVILTCNACSLVICVRMGNVRVTMTVLFLSFSIFTYCNACCAECTSNVLISSVCNTKTAPLKSQFCGFGLLSRNYTKHMSLDMAF